MTLLQFLLMLVAGWLQRAGDQFAFRPRVGSETNHGNAAARHDNQARREWLLSRASFALE